ncbi:MFS transporter [Marinilabiliaceae bacterium JC017]|nr:MFS transporter [Marinilabiliaceae bacterium JC017]
MTIQKDTQYYKFCAYGFLKNLRFFDPFLILFFLDKGMSYFQIGTLYAIREITVNLFEIPSGFMADVLGRKRVMVVSFVSYIFSFFLFYALSGFGWFVLAFLFYGFGDAFRTGTHKAMILSYLKRHGMEADKALYYGHTRSCSQRGSAVSALLSAAIVFYTGNYNMIFLASSIPYMLDLGLLLSYPSYLNGDERNSMKKTVFSWSSHWQLVKSTFSQMQTFRIIANTSVYTGYYKAVKDYIQPLIVSFALVVPLGLIEDNEKRTALIVGLVYSLIFLVNSVASRRSSKVGSWLGSLDNALNVLLVLGFMLGIMAGVLHWFEINLGAIVVFGGIMVVQNLRRPLGVSYISEKFDDKIMATALSADSQSETLVAVIIAPLLGFLADSFGAGLAVGAVSSLLLLIFIVLKVK